MTARIALTVARMHGVLVARPSSPVFHIYAGPVTQSGRFVPSAGRPVCGARTRRLSVLERVATTLDLDGRRVCERCAARLHRSERRGAQPVSREARVGHYRGVTLGDLVVATALAGTVDETHAVGNVASLVHGPCHPSTSRRPVELSYRQARYDLEVAILARRRVLAAAERTPDEVAAARTRREMQADEAERQRVAQTRAYQNARHEDRLNAGQYTTAWERARAAQHA